MQRHSRSPKEIRHWPPKYKVLPDVTLMEEDSICFQLEWINLKQLKFKTSNYGKILDKISQIKNISYMNECN